MKRLLPLLLLLSLPAMAGESTSVAVSNTTPTKMPSIALTGRRSILVENRGTNAIYCSYSSSVTVNNGHKLPGGGGPASRLEFPSDILYCIAETAAQTGEDSDLTVVSEVP